MLRPVRGGHGKQLCFSAIALKGKREGERMSLPQFEVSQKISGEVVADAVIADANATLAAAFEGSPDAMAIIEMGGRLRYFNRTFNELCGSAPAGRGLSHYSTACLPALSGLKELVAMAVKDSRETGRSKFRAESIVLSAAGVKYVASISSINSPDFSPDSHPTKKLFLMVIRESCALLNERIEAIRSHFHLTVTETRALTMFAGGSDLSRIALELGVTIHTARAHMKSLLSKTGCRRQANLARLLETASTGFIRIFA
jgi:DNA-binding CsgD family transcriptional regulator